MIAGWESLPSALAAHLAISAAALALALLVATPLVLLMPGRPWLRRTVMGLASVVQTVPALALLALFFPLLVLLRNLTGLPVPSLGLLPSLLALALYALLPLLRGGAGGLAAVPDSVRDAARAIGMSPAQRLFHVELSLAAPVVMGGVRTAAVWTIGAATLATMVGQESLGDLIFAGLQLQDWKQVLLGCVAAAALALIVDGALGWCQAGIAQRRWAPAAKGLALLALLSLGVTGWWLHSRPATTAKPVLIGTKTFSEQYILAELIAADLRHDGIATGVRSGLGSGIAFKSLAAGGIDISIDYTGTLWTQALERNDVVPRAMMLPILTRELKARYGVTVAARLGFENAYALAMRRADSDRLGVRSISDLARVSGKLRLATDLEFLSRSEWAALRQAYGLEFASARAFTPVLMVAALKDGSADVITAYSSDGALAGADIVLLTDDRAALPAYDALLLVAPGRDDLVRQLARYDGRISVEAMRVANWQADRPEGKRSPVEAAQWLARQTGLQP
ncbi:glycine betaine ABC transporter substrate-binding protein [Sandarakinorhabdus sp. AAP62]|uniref:ABC transporter permease/substrate-binding protein n=1 Tax=Sandarakinorhabdus sp. AAP62 TaxID=1248916 RepID=UPI0002E183FD|nr:glycine betaine ABC transporter substrate-binding protein [Sandarakinorhabdus sp. AAP62]